MTSCTGPGKKQELSTWNAVEHELALARQASALDGGQRQSRIAAWTSRQNAMHGKASASDPSELLVTRVTHFKSHSESQLLLFLRADETVSLCLPLTSFRGAVLAGKGNPRRLQVARPSAAPLPAGLVKAVRVVELVESSKTTWVATGLNPVSMLDTTSVLAEVRAKEITRNSSRTTVKLSKEALEAMADFIKKAPWKEAAAAEEKVAWVHVGMFWQSVALQLVVSCSVKVFVCFRQAVSLSLIFLDKVRRPPPAWLSANSQA